MSAEEVLRRLLRGGRQTKLKRLQTAHGQPTGIFFCQNRQPMRDARGRQRGVIHRFTCLYGQFLMYPSMRAKGSAERRHRRA